MKRLIFSLLFLLLVGLSASAQQGSRPRLAGEPDRKELKVIFVNENVSTHLIFPEQVEYVDISIPDIAGDIPTANVVRLKPTKKGASGVVTITGERFMVQYLLVYNNNLSEVYTRYNIPYDDMNSYLNPSSNMTTSQLYDYCYRMFVSKNRYYNVASNKNGLRTVLNNIYTMDKYFFIDLGILNKTNIQYDIEDIQFRIEDKKKTKATNFQAIELLPLLQLQQDKQFTKSYRNVFAFEKFTFPEEKIFVIEITEKQISGRILRVEISYSDILKADSFVL